jgi:MFS family permease
MLGKYVMNEFKKNKPFRFLVLSGLFEIWGNQMFNLVFLIYAATLPNKTLAVSVVTFEMFLPDMLPSLTGQMADKTINKVRTKLKGSLVQTLLYIVMTGLFLLPKSLPIFFIMVIIMFIADSIGTYNSGLEAPIIKHSVPDDHLEEALSFSQALSQTTNLISQASGAALLLVAAGDFAIFSLLNALAYALSAITLLPYFKTYDIIKSVIEQSPLPEVKNRVKHFFLTLIAALKSNFSEPHIRSLVLILVIANMITGSLVPLITVSLTDYTAAQLFGNSLANTIVALNISFTLGMIFGNLSNFSVIQQRSPQVLVTWNIIMVLFIGANFIFLQNMYITMILFFIVAFLLGNIGPKISALLISEIQENSLATALGALNTVLTISIPAMSTLLLLIANSVSTSIAWISLLSFAMVALFFIVTIAKSITRSSKLS